jgi:trypsin
MQLHLDGLVLHLRKSARSASHVAVLSLLALMTLGLPDAGGGNESRIVVGKDVTGVVALLNASAPLHRAYVGQFCGGVLVEERVVLTAAHCVAGRAPETIDVLVGTHDLCRDAGGRRVRATRIELHPHYEPASSRFDLARLTLQEPVAVATVRRVGDVSNSRDIGIVLGWGVDWRTGVAGCRLTSAFVRLLDPHSCRHEASAEDRLFHDGSMLCAVGIHGADACAGDSGGPLVAGIDRERGAVIGIVSWGRACGDGVPGVYARANGWLNRVTLDYDDEASVRSPGPKQ